MALLKIKHEGNIKEIFIASMAVSDLATVELIPGAASAMRQVTMAATGNEHLVAGVARGAVTSGAIVWVITHGFVSGVVVATSAVQAGDRLMTATSGRVTPFNTITPVGYPIVSGWAIVSGGGLMSGIQTASGLISGYVRVNLSGLVNISGGFVGTAFNTGRVLGRAITSGGSGAAIQMLVHLE